MLTIPLWLNSNSPDLDSARIDPRTLLGQRSGRHPLFAGGYCAYRQFSPFEFRRLCAPAYIRRKFFAVVFAATKFPHHAIAPPFFPERVAGQRSKAIDDGFRQRIWIFAPPCAACRVSQ